jgi:Flp pilus assembly protein TadD
VSFEAAAEHVQAAVALDPSQPEAFNLLGALREIAGDRIGAQKNYRIALTLDPRYQPAVANLMRATGASQGKIVLP